MTRSRWIGMAGLASLWVAAGAAAREPVRLVSVDPLARPAPREVSPLALPEDRRPAAEKVTPALWARAVAAAGVETLAVIVTLHTPAERDGADADSGDREARRIERVAAVGHRFAEKARAVGLTGARGLSRFPIVFGRIAPRRLAELAGLPEVSAIEEDQLRAWSRIEGGALLKATELRTGFGGGGAGIGVAVVDSGVDATHPELATRIVTHLNTSGIPGDALTDELGHGTAVAGIVAGTSGGVAPEASLWAFKVGGAAGPTDSAVLLALDAAYAERENFGGLRVVNLSFGGGGPFAADCDASAPAYATVLGQMAAAGIVTFVSSGNQAFKDGVASPACLSTVVAVGAVYDADLGGLAFDECFDLPIATDQIACYSNSGPPLDLLAPAHCARTPVPGGGYDNCFGGTSAAAPYAAGVAAQILSLLPATTPQQLAAALAATGRPLTDVNGLARPRIDAVAAYQALAGSGPTEPCVPDDVTLCVDDEPGDRRFRVRMEFANAQDSGFAHAVPLASLGVTQGGLFWIGRLANPEMLIKLLDACVEPFHRFWVFAAATTDQGLTTTVTDTRTGRVRTYTNPLGTAAAPVLDTDAFPCE